VRVVVADLTVGFELGDRGVVQAIVEDACGVVSTALSIPNHAWPGWSNGKSPCRVDGYVERFDWPEGVSPAYIVRTLDDDHLYEFRRMVHAMIDPRSLLCAPCEDEMGDEP